MKKSIFLAIACVLFTTAFGKAPKSYYYQLKVYHFKTLAQGQSIEKYLESAYLPALHRAGISKAGVFKPVTPDSTDRTIYVFVPFNKLDKWASLGKAIDKDKQYAEEGKEYLAAAYNTPPYTRIETILLEAFDGMPEPGSPNLTAPKSERVYELRSYESATENLGLNKIEMFNLHEVKVFKELNFNPVFYGQVLSGSHTPNLMYMTTFNNKADRDKHWVDFNVAYKPISAMPQYQHNVSKNTITFLTPTDYSDY